MRKFAPISLISTFLMLFLIILLLLITSGCSKAATTSGKTIVAVTLLPQAGFVEAIGGDKVEVVVMVPPGASLTFIFSLVQLPKRLYAQPDMRQIETCDANLGFTTNITDLVKRSQLALSLPISTATA
jgi:hypothetical protein